MNRKRNYEVTVIFEPEEHPEIAAMHAMEQIMQVLDRNGGTVAMKSRVAQWIYEKYGQGVTP